MAKDVVIYCHKHFKYFDVQCLTFIRLLVCNNLKIVIKLLINKTSNRKEFSNQYASLNNHFYTSYSIHEICLKTYMSKLL